MRHRRPIRRLPCWSFSSVPRPPSLDGAGVIVLSKCLRQLIEPCARYSALSVAQYLRCDSGVQFALDLRARCHMTGGTRESICIPRPGAPVRTRKRVPSPRSTRSPSGRPLAFRDPRCRKGRAGLSSKGAVAPPAASRYLGRSRRQCRPEGWLRGAAIFCPETSFQFTFRAAYLPNYQPRI